MSLATGSGEIVNMEVDYSETVDKRIPEIKAVAGSGNLNKALEELLVLEKQTRTVRVKINKTQYLRLGVK